MDWNKRTLTDNEEKSIPLFDGRPDREKIISYEDMLNLTILLNTETDFDSLLAKL